MAMTTSAAGVKYLALEEGVMTKAYKDPVGIWTIGIGHVGPIDMPGLKVSKLYTVVNGKTVPATITKAQAEELLSYDLKKDYEPAVNKYITVKLKQHQFDALVSFCYNCGAGGLQRSQLCKYINGGGTDPASIKYYFELWRNAGGKPILLKRRGREASLYNTGVYPTKLV